jgi:hypothetical protein
LHRFSRILRGLTRDGRGPLDCATTAASRRMTSQCSEPAPRVSGSPRAGMRRRLIGITLCLH